MSKWMNQWMMKLWEVRMCGTLCHNWKSTFLIFIQILSYKIVKGFLKFDVLNFSRNIIIQTSSFEHFRMGYISESGSMLKSNGESAEYQITQND